MADSTPPDPSGGWETFERVYDDEEVRARLNRRLDAWLDVTDPYAERVIPPCSPRKIATEMWEDDVWGNGYETYRADTVEVVGYTSAGPVGRPCVKVTGMVHRDWRNAGGVRGGMVIGSRNAVEAARRTGQPT